MTDTKDTVMARAMLLDAQDRSFQATTDSEREICAQLASDGCLLSNGPDFWVVTAKAGRTAPAPSPDTYEGFTNRETWCANLWIANDECAYHGAQSLARDAVARAIRAYEDGEFGFDGTDDAGRIRKLATADLAECLENDFSPEPMGGMVGDLLSTACARIDWREIAASWLADLRLVPLRDEESGIEGAVYSYRAEGL